MAKSFSSALYLGVHKRNDDPFSRSVRNINIPSPAEVPKRPSNALAWDPASGEILKAENSPKLPFGIRLGLGAIAAGTIAVPLSLGVTVIDRSVTLFANGSEKSVSSAVGRGAMNVFRSPFKMFMGLDNRAVFGVYGATYITKNAADISCREYEVDPHWPLFCSTILVNGVLGIMKDRYLAQMFDPKGIPNFPMISYGCFMARDCVLVSISFIFAPLLGPVVERNTGLSPFISDVVAQVSVPSCGQLLATPIHLAGLDFYNRPEVDLQTRIVDAIKASRGPILVRMFRQGYVFGVGSLAIKYFTKFLIE